MNNLKISLWKSTKEFAKPKRIGIFIITFILIYSILVTSFITKKYNLTVGEIAKFDIKATREIVDEESTKAKTAQVEQSLSANPPYIKKTEIVIAAVDNINKLFSKAMELTDVTVDENEKINTLKKEIHYDMAPEDMQSLIRFSKEDLKVLQGFLVTTITQLYQTKIEENKPEDIKAAQDFITNEFTKAKLDLKFKNVAISIAFSEIKPNFVIDKEGLNNNIKEKLRSVPPIVIKKDQIIVKEGEPVTERQISLLQELGLLGDYSSLEWYMYISLGALIFTVLILQWLYLYKYDPEVMNDNSKLVLISVVNCIALLLARTLSLISPYLIPLACAPMLLTLLINYRVSLVLSLLNGLLISSIVGFNTEIILITILNGILGAIITKKMQARNDILFSAIFISIINVIVTLSIGVLLSNHIIEILKKSGFTCIGGIVSAILTIGFLPFLESTFDIVTTVKLLELSNPNNSLLKKLLIEAPGTYHHSILVANLSEVAAEEIGGNPVLARVGAYYHDVGKIRRPYFFKENQMGNDNPHNKITPNLSALVVTSHVKDGLELAKAEKLPKVIRDIIEQHHGTSLVKYFYITMKNSSDNPNDINEEDFRYPGPLPKGKEAGIIMLADSVEAAVRSINEPTIDKIELMVNNIIKDRLNDGQLDECEITLRDLEKIKKTFVKSLTGIYHQRIEYPTDKWESKN